MSERPRRVRSRVCCRHEPGLRHEEGYALVMVMIILTIVSVIGVAGMQISMLAERGARNDRDYQIAWQAAESGLSDAVSDIHGPGASARRGVFFPSVDTSAFIDGCGSAGDSTGLCRLSTGSKPAWLTVDFNAEGDNARTTPYGRFTGRVLPAGAHGLQPARASRYVVELLPDPDDVNAATCTTDCLYVYRVTAMGFGLRTDTQAVLQMLYRD
ncbi:MAG: hypothetical protein EOO28_27170 [Comamonadaceae bacterium]|nr:MAG: hypothetical protein EOO28_27170 [Comamonadaceae bacterium]